MFSNFRLIDLTHTLDGSIPTWNGSCGFHHEVKMDYDQGVRVLSYKMHAGVGTHMDAPSHFYCDGKHIADLPLEQLITPLYMIDVANRSHPDFLLSRADILAFEKKHGEISKGSALLLNTGWSSRWGDVEAFRNPDSSGKMHFPGFSTEAALLLLERGVVGIGIDTLSPDGVNPNGDFPVHQHILGAGKYILENLTNLEKVPATGALLVALPLKIREGTESAVRAVAVI
ncbi:MAG: cyclase family protein [Chlamydiales bacterium]|nr:cyclase family protein [Chlamydiales bacterium]